MTPETLARLDAVIAEALETSPDAITPDIGAGRHAEWDSAAQLRLAFGVEEVFGFQPTLDEIERMTSRAALIDVLATRGIA